MGNALQIISSNNIRGWIGEMLDNQGTICVHGPKIYAAQRHGDRVYVRWKLIEDHKEEKRWLVNELTLNWKP